MHNTILSQTCRSFLTETWEYEQDPYRKKILALGVLVTATTINDSDLLNLWFPKCSEYLDQRAIEEAILQTLLFAGFPRTIEALKVMRVHFPESSNGKQVEDRVSQGDTTSKLVYGKHHPRLKEVMDELHPDLTRWMIEDGYGRVLSRPGLDLPDREISVVVSLMASGMLNQYRAHVRGALLAGVTPDNISWFTNIFKCIVPENMQDSFEEITVRSIENYLSAED